MTSHDQPEQDTPGRVLPSQRTSGQHTTGQDVLGHEALEPGGQVRRMARELAAMYAVRSAELLLAGQAVAAEAAARWWQAMDVTARTGQAPPVLPGE